MRRRVSLSLVCRLLAVVALAAPSALRAQDVTGVALKGAFIFNFARFTEWPAQALPAGAPVSACVVGDPAVAAALTQAVRGRRIDGRTINVTSLQAEAPLPTCHLLYVSGVSQRRVSDIVSAVRDSPVLTVSDNEEFNKKGGVVQLFLEAGKMRFSINLRSAKRAKLQLSSRLLALADIVEGESQASDLPIVVPAMAAFVSPSL